MAKRNLSGMITQVSSDLQPLRNRGRGLDGMISDSSLQVQPDMAIITGDEITLSTQEVDEFATCERIIERGLRTFLDVGVALLKIRDLRLYRVDYATFEEYYRDRWSLERSQVYRLMDAAEVTRNLQNSPMGEFPLPANERQARPLVRLKDPAQQREAWHQAVSTANGRITADHVAMVVREILAQQSSIPASMQLAKVSETDSPSILAHESEKDNTDVATLRKRNAELERRLTTAQSIIEEYQEHITRAQQYQPTSDRGEAVSPLLRALERVWLMLQDGQ